MFGVNVSLVNRKKTFWKKLKTKRAALLSVIWLSCGRKMQMMLPVHESQEKPFFGDIFQRIVFLSICFLTMRLRGR